MAIVEKIKYRLADDSSRMALGLKIQDQNLKLDSVITFIIDTGVSCVLLPSSALYLEHEQENFIKLNAEPVNHCGIITNKTVTYYRYFVSKFGLGTIVFRDFPIHITFEKNATMRLLGMPFLKMFDISIRPQKQLVEFSALPVTEKMITNEMSVKGIENVVTANTGAADILSQLQIENAAIDAHKIVLGSE